MKAFEVKITIGGAVGHVIIGGGVLNATVKDVASGESALYTIYMAGIGVGLPAFRATSKAFRFSESDDKTVTSFAGYGYLGGISLEAGVGVKIGGGIKIPNGPLIPTEVARDHGGVDISVSHNVTRWAL